MTADLQIHDPILQRFLIICGDARSMPALGRQYGAGNVVLVTDPKDFPFALVEHLEEFQDKAMAEYDGKVADGEDAELPLCGFGLFDAEAILEMLSRSPAKAAT